MKPLSDIRRQNLLSLVAQEGTQVAVATKLGKDKNQIYQWLLDPGTDGARNIGPKSARHIESAFGKPEGWLDHEQNVTDSASQSVGLVQEKLAAAIEWVRDASERWGPFTADKEAVLVKGIYGFLIQPETPNLLEVAEWVGKHAGGEDDRQEQAGSFNQDGARGHGRKAS